MSCNESSYGKQTQSCHEEMKETLTFLTFHKLLFKTVEDFDFPLFFVFKYSHVSIG